MSKENKATEIEVTKKEETKQMSSAFSIVKDSKTLKYTVIKIPFDVETGEVSELEVVGVVEARDEANELFKISVAKARILG